MALLTPTFAVSFIASFTAAVGADFMVDNVVVFIKFLAIAVAAALLDAYVAAPTADNPPVIGVSNTAPIPIIISTAIGASCSAASCSIPISTPKISAIALF